jgi:head-tail adaptor
MDPARLDTRVTFLEETPGSDASGSVVTWVAGDPPDVVYAEVVPMRGIDQIRAGQDVSQVWLTVTTRYRPGRVPKSRLMMPSGDMFIIMAIENVSFQNRWLVFNCLALGANANE